MRCVKGCDVLGTTLIVLSLSIWVFLEIGGIPKSSVLVGFSLITTYNSETPHIELSLDLAAICNFSEPLPIEQFNFFGSIQGSKH